MRPIVIDNQTRQRPGMTRARLPGGPRPRYGARTLSTGGMLIRPRLAPSGAETVSRRSTVHLAGVRSARERVWTSPATSRERSGNRGGYRAADRHTITPRYSARIGHPPFRALWHPARGSERSDGLGGGPPGRHPPRRLYRSLGCRAPLPPRAGAGGRGLPRFGGVAPFLHFSSRPLGAGRALS